MNFGRYEIKDEIGRGGMATVFHAYDPRFERYVAIKVLPKELMHESQFRARFEREAKLVALLEHPAIVPVYDLGDEEGQPYIVMRYMSGGSLADKLQKGHLSIDEVAKIMLRLAPGLDAAHEEEIIHRDLKPGNILFDHYGNAYLSDFGIARLKQSASISTLTGNAILGTPAYMSPEQVQGDQEIDSRSDIYSLGVILYQMLTGKTPYLADTPAKVMMMHVLEPVPNIMTDNSELPQGFSFVINSAMAKDPEDRYQKAIDLAEAVESAAIGGSMVTKILSNNMLQSLDYNREAKNTPPHSPAVKPKSDIPAIEANPINKSPSAVKKPFWLWLIASTIILLLVTLISVGSSALFYKYRTPPTVSPKISQVYVSADIQTTSTTEMVISTTLPTQTIINTSRVQPTDKVAAVPSSTATIEPTSTTEEQDISNPTVIGGADKVAFINNNDIWIANLDGSNLFQLTNDSAKKINIQWAPGGNELFYISGKCIQSVNIESTKRDNIACFEYVASLDAFEISPDGTQSAISINHELYIVPFERDKLSQVNLWRDIKDMAVCEKIAPYSSNSGTAYSVKIVHWSDDMQSLSIVVSGVQEGQQIDLVRIIDISKCIPNPRRLDEFPANRFIISGYRDNPRITNFSWDGIFMFALTSFVRNGGFGDLYIYNADLHVVQAKINPINNMCCYRDPHWSPDGTYLLFAYQDINLGANSSIQLYYVPYGTMGTGLRYTPFPLPENFFLDPKGSPQAVLRPAIDQ